VDAWAKKLSKSVHECTTINTAIIDKPLTINTPPPRVETSINETPILNVPPPRVVESPKADREKIMLNPNLIKLRQHISNSKKQSKNPSPSPNGIAK
jgi:hypothetical protein